MRKFNVKTLAFIPKVVSDVGKEMERTQLLLVASSLAYTTILSLIPLLAVSFAIFQAFGGLEKLYGTIEPMILSNLAEGSSDEVIQKIREMIKNANGSAVGLGGFVGLVFTSMSMLASVEKAINRIWGAPLNRSFFSRISAYWLFITLGPLALAVGVGAATSADFPIARILPGGTGLFLMTVVGFTAIYKWVPHTRVHALYAAISGAFAAVLFILAQFGFRLYTSRVLTYSKIYGSLGAIPIFILWIYIVWVVVLAGAALTAALQRRAAEIEKLAKQSFHAPASK